MLSKTYLQDRVVTYFDSRETKILQDFANEEAHYAKSVQRAVKTNQAIFDVLKLHGPAVPRNSQAWDALTTTYIRTMPVAPSEEHRDERLAQLEETRAEVLELLENLTKTELTGTDIKTLGLSTYL